MNSASKPSRPAIIAARKISPPGLYQTTARKIDEALGLPGVIAVLKKAEKVVYLDRLNAAYHAYNTSAESKRIADKDKLVLEIRAAVAKLEGFQ